MGRLGLLALGGLSLAPCLLEALAPALGPPAGSSRLGLALLPWLALAGLPQRSPGLPPATLLGAALPPTLLAAALDAAAGIPRGALAGALGTGLVLLTLWAAAALAAAVRPGRTYALLWTLAVPGVAALRLALAWAPRSGASAGGEPAGLLHRASPLVWAHGWAGRDALAEGAPPLDPVPLLVAALALALVLASRTEEREEEGA